MGALIGWVPRPETSYRKGYQGSSIDDMWICIADGTNNLRVTTHKGQDSYPTWSADGKSLYYVSDVTGGLANIVSQNIESIVGDNGPLPKPVAVTTHKDEFVRRARIGANGRLIAYEWGPDI